MTLAEAELCCQHQDRSGHGDCEEVTSVRTGEAGGDNCHGLMPGPWSCDLRCLHQMSQAGEETASPGCGGFQRLDNCQSGGLQHVWLGEWK